MKSFALILSCILPFIQAQTPTVTLPYVTHKAILSTAVETSGTFTVAKYQNIRFAAAPTGDLRWRAPVEPAPISGVQDGSIGSGCPQQLPAWLGGLQIGNNEDCLFLDVYQPLTTTKKNLPVMFWIYGGGYTLGAKDTYNPAGLFREAGYEIVVVAINYRLGAFGWVSGATVAADGVEMPALYDQRFALQWVQDHISLFNGDPSQVTVFGESAGGGSILHQITAFGSSESSGLFQQAILQSAAFLVQPDLDLLEEQFQNFSANAGCSTLQCLRSASTQQLVQANSASVRAAAYGTFTFGPGVTGPDGIVPDMPHHLLAIGGFDKSVKVMAAHNADEGRMFTPPGLETDAQIEQYLCSATPTLCEYKDAVLARYPPANADTPYRNQNERLKLLISESIFTCTTYLLAEAYDRETYNYQYVLNNAGHGDDIGKTWGNNPLDTVGVAMQDYFTSFAITKDPNYSGGVQWPEYGDASNTMYFNSTNFVAKDNVRPDICCFWQAIFQKAKVTDFSCPSGSTPPSSSSVPSSTVKPSSTSVPSSSVSTRPGASSASPSTTASSKASSSSSFVRQSSSSRAYGSSSSGQLSSGTRTKVCTARTNTGTATGGNGGSNPTGGNGGSNPTGGNGGSNPTGGNGGSYPTGGNGGSNPTGGNGGSNPTGGNGGSNPTGGNGGSNPTGGNGGSYPTGGNGGSNPTGGNGGSNPTGGNGGSNPTGGNGGGVASSSKALSSSGSGSLSPSSSKLLASAVSSSKAASSSSKLLPTAISKSTVLTVTRASASSSKLLASAVSRSVVSRSSAANGSSASASASRVARRALRV